MSYFEQREPPKREDRLQARIAFGGTLCGLADKTRGCCLDDRERGFTQGSICLLLPGLAMLNSLPDSVVLLHGAIGCGACSHSQNANVRAGSNLRRGKVKDALWLSTALSETDVISGGEVKLEEAIREVDRRYRPSSIIVAAGCVPGIIGDDIDGVAARLQPQVSAKILPVHCEGFKTKIWATAYDAVYHAIGRNLLDEPREYEQFLQDEFAELKEKHMLSRTVNLMNVSSMGRVDELELSRLLRSLGLEVNIFPVFAHPEEMYKVTRAAVSISTCPTHDDYFLKHLEEKYGIPYIIRHMPIGIDNTSLWIRDVAAFFGLEEQAEKLIAEEVRELQNALEEFKPLFKGKKVFVSAGEIRALANGQLLRELGFEVAGIRSFHHDEYAEAEYEKLAAGNRDFVFNIANAQPFEEVNMLKRTKPDLFLGHWCGNATASKLGIATHVIYNTGLSYIGYQGVYELARRLYRQLKNPLFNKRLSRYVPLPYTDRWYEADPFKYIKTIGGEGVE
ncbi:MAG: Nitrogenase vanadium-iron protein alpha chain [Pelotomaculum sp. PtaU1.Bin035]|nr:MAG: Nitrogenase vanadium-iron protein alpha chain [Pelotomaculum sp. PtaU1.Bin035]